MKRTFSIKFVGILLIIFLFLSVTMINIGFQSSTTQIYVDPSNVVYWAPAFGETFIINVSIAGVSNLQCFELKLYWNTTLLDLVKVDVQPFLNPPTQIFKNEKREDLGRYWLAISSTGPPKTGSGALVTLSFKITYEPIWPENVTSALDLRGTLFYDFDGNPIPHDVSDGEYSCYSASPLKITTMTSKEVYFRLDNIHIYGNLTLGFSLVTDGLVALEVVDPLNNAMVVRTCLTGTPPASQMIEIVNVYSCDENGNPRNSFNKGPLAFAYFNVTIKNNDAVEIERWVRIVLNLFDSKNKPIGIKTYKGPVRANSTSYQILSVPIPDTAEVGDAHVYASALTEWPRYNGTACCPEKSDSFQIVESGYGGARSSSSPEGPFDLIFKMPSDAELGNYTIYATSKYTTHSHTVNATDTLTFEVTEGSGLGPWDINGDGVVNIADIVIIAIHFGGATVDDPETGWDETQLWDPIADLNGDGVINIADITIVAIHFGESII